MKEQYLIISGTNREGSNTYKVAVQYLDALKKKNIEAEIISLEDLDVQSRTGEMIQLESEKLIPTQKYIFISPEYNGSIPGVLKSLFDISDYKKVWWGKKALLVGISSGRSGNVRGMEHLTTILNYLKVVVHPNKLPISSVNQLINGNGMIHDPETVSAIDTQLNEYIHF